MNPRREKRRAEPEIRRDGPLSEPFDFEVVENYVAPPMTAERIMWYGRGMEGTPPKSRDKATQEWYLGAHVFKKPFTYAEGVFVSGDETMTPEEVFEIVKEKNPAATVKKGPPAQSVKTRR